MCRCPRRARTLAAAACALLGACTAMPSELRVAAKPELPDAVEFPGAARWLRGFDSVGRDGEWRRGDEVLFGLRLLDGGRAERWLLHVRIDEVDALDPDAPSGAAPLPPITWRIKVNGAMQAFESRLMRTTVTVADAGGEQLGRSSALLPRDLLGKGFVQACLGAEIASPDEVPMVEAMVSLMALLQVVREDSVLAPILWQVVQGPSVLSVVFHFGVRVAVQPRFHATTRVHTPPQLPPGDPAWSVPITLTVNDEPALLCEVLVGRPLPPRLLCGGIVAATARHPAEARREFAMVLLAAKRAAYVP